MGEVTVDLVAELRADNPQARAIDLRIYADALRLYHEAAANVRTHGAICMHPRTGAPIDNPYLRVQAQQAGVLAKLRYINSDRVTTALAQDS